MAGEIGGGAMVMVFTEGTLEPVPLEATSIIV